MVNRNLLWGLRLAHHQAQQRCSRPAVYDQDFADWANQAALPLKRLPRFEKLVYPEWVNALLRGEHPETYNGRGFILLHVNFGVPEEYAYEHLPQARYLNTNRLEARKTWNRRSTDEITATLLQLGISADTPVVLYGRDSVPANDEAWPGRHAGQIAAYRAAALMNYAGVKDVRVLDGGFDAWVAAGLPVESEPREPTPISDFGQPISAQLNVFIDLAEAKALIADPNGRLVSIRTWAEFTGQVSGYNYIGRQGRIAGAVWGNCGANAYHMQHYRSPANTMRAYYEIEANWEQAGIRSDNQIAFYCGTGWRASETLFYAQLLGWDKVSVYDGGWYEWSRDPGNPVEVGLPAPETAGSPEQTYQIASIREYSGA